jgi:hypothetical protein
VTAKWWQHKRIVISLAGRNRIRLRDRVLADWLKDQIAGLLAQVVGVKAWLAAAGLSWVEVEANVEVAVWLRPFKVDGAA